MNSQQLILVLDRIKEPMKIATLMWLPLKKYNSIYFISRLDWKENKDRGKKIFNHRILNIQ